MKNKKNLQYQLVGDVAASLNNQVRSSDDEDKFRVGQVWKFLFFFYKFGSHDYDYF